MSADWPHALAARSVPRDDIGVLGDKIAEDNGESRFVCRLADHPGWLYKEYQSPLPIPGAAQLATLIDLPQKMTVDDMMLTIKQISWPASRVTGDTGETVGVIMPQAPREFSTDLILPATGRRKTSHLTIDLLASSAEKQAALGIPSQSLDKRLAVAKSLLAVADLFERHGLVYLDWSYANAFWSTGNHSVYVIDMDGASIGPRRQIQSPNWDDPLFPFGAGAGNETDRYRVALLVARCLTGLRPADGDLDVALAAIGQGQELGALVRILRRALSAQDAAQRPSLGDLKAVLDRARVQDTPSDPVTDWVPISAIKHSGQPSGTPTPPPVNALPTSLPPGTFKPAPRLGAAPTSRAGSGLRGLAAFLAVFIFILLLLALAHT